MSPPLKGGRGDSSIFPRLHRTIPESIPMQSRTIPDFFITFFLKKFAYIKKKHYLCSRN